MKGQINAGRKDKGLRRRSRTGVRRGSWREQEGGQRRKVSGRGRTIEEGEQGVGQRRKG